MTYELHPLCTLFPRLNGSEFAALRDDIAANGMRQPIVLHGGMILDGGNRYRACIEASVEPTFAEFTGGNLVSFVLSANLHRRHMSIGQQAAIVASAQDWAKSQQHGGARRGDQVATLPLETIKARAAESGASERTQRMADKVAKADPELARKVAHGDVSLPKAHASLTPAPAPAKPETRSLTTEAPSRAEYEQDELRSAVQLLAQDNERLADRLAVEAMDATEEERTAASTTISELRAENLTLRAELDATRSSRDTLLVENAALKRQCESLLRKLKKVEQAA